MSARQIPVRRLGAIALLLAAVVVANTAQAVRQRENENPPGNVERDGPWREAEIAPPVYPQGRDLVEFRPNGTTANRFYIDATSLTVGADEVVRFVLVIRSAADVDNVSFSGLRCETKEWKDYAFAGRDQTWRVDDKAQWRRIQVRTRNNFQETLFKDYFCFGGAMSGGPVGDAKTLVRNLKYPLVQDNRTPRRYNQRGN